MSNEEFEIEYLDEDAEVVQQCLENVEDRFEESDENTVNQDLSVNKLFKVTKKKRNYDDDDDYEPKYVKNLRRGRKPGPFKGKKSYVFTDSQSNLTAEPEENVDLKEMKKLICNTIITDYTDPCFLPAVPDMTTLENCKKFREWDDACFWYSNKLDTSCDSETGTVTKLLLKKKITDSAEEIQVSHKTLVTTSEGNKWVDTFQGILPKFTEIEPVLEKTSDISNLKLKNSDKVVTTTLLRCIDIEGSKILAVHKPDESITSTFKLKDNFSESSITKSSIAEANYYCLKGEGLVSCCALCYQYSCRGSKKSDISAEDCILCDRTFTTAYNMLSHLRSHSKEEVKRKKFMISNILAKFMGYHYTCQICFKKLLSIRHMRRHIKKMHSGSKRIYCEVGNHWTK